MKSYEKQVLWVIDVNGMHFVFQMTVFKMDISAFVCYVGVNPES